MTIKDELNPTQNEIIEENKINKSGTDRIKQINKR